MTGKNNQWYEPPSPTAQQQVRQNRMDEAVQDHPSKRGLLPFYKLLILKDKIPYQMGCDQHTKCL